MLVQPEDLTLDGFSQTSSSGGGVLRDIATDTDFPEVIHKKAHAAVAASQQGIADTTAEFWYSHGRTHDYLQDFLRGSQRNASKINRIDIELAESLQRSILNAKLPTPIIVYRGTMERDWDGQHVGTILANADIGERVAVGGFCSTTTNPDMAVGFTGIGRNSEDRAVILCIETDQGKFLPTSSSQDDHGYFLEESEVVLPHGGVYEVLDRKEIGYRQDTSRPALAVALRYVGTDEDDQTFKALADVASGLPSDSDHAEKYLRVPLRRKMRHYRLAGLPIGEQTTSI